MKNKKEVSAVQVISKASDFNKNSKQVTEETGFSVDVIEYPVSPQKLWLVANSSFIVNWSMKKVVWGVNTKVTSEQLSDDQLKIFQKIKRKMVTYWVKNIYTNWNAWFELIKNGKWEIIEILPMITDTIRLLPWWEGAVQKVWAEEAYFNIYEPNEELRIEKEEFYEKTSANAQELVSTDDWTGRKRTWRNPALNDVILIKEANIDTAYYWKSKIESCIDQLILLSSIDQYFIKFFEKGTMKAKILYDKSWKMTTGDKALIKTLYEQKAQGLKNAFNSIMISWDIWEIGLDSDLDASQFNAMRQELRQDILVDLEIPYDILYSDNSNKSTSQSAKENFYNFTIDPFQEMFEDQLNELAESYWENVEIFFTRTDTKDVFEEAKILVSMVSAWIITANEARNESEYDLDEIEGWDELSVKETNKEDLTAIEKVMILKNEIDDLKI